MASCSLWSARATRRWQSSRSARKGVTPVNIRKPINAAAASAVFPKGELFERCRMGVPSSWLVVNILTAPTLTRYERTRRHGTYITLTTALFHSAFRGAATEPMRPLRSSRTTKRTVYSPGGCGEGFLFCQQRCLGGFPSLGLISFLWVY